MAVVDGYRESEQSWYELLLDLKQRGLSLAPTLAIGDGALGFWTALSGVPKSPEYLRPPFAKPLMPSRPFAHAIVDDDRWLELAQEIVHRLAIFLGPPIGPLTVATRYSNRYPLPRLASVA